MNSNQPDQTFPADYFSDHFENEWIAKKALQHRKTWGQYFTPFLIADWMSAWVLAEGSPKHVLDPALGTGIFFRACQKNYSQPLIFTGFELEPEIHSLATNCLIPRNGEQFNIIRQDFLENDWEKRYPAILCNPPYQRFKNHPKRNDQIYLLENRLGIKIDRQTNIYSLFLLKSLHQLESNGRAAFILPFEFLNADYGQLIKTQILAKRSLQAVVWFKKPLNLFPGAITTTSILLFGAHNSAAESVQFIQVDTPDQLPNPKNLTADSKRITVSWQSIPIQSLLSQKKWRNLKISIPANAQNNLVPLSTFGKVMRGIATGDNDFFTLSQKEALSFNLPQDSLLPCVSRANYVKNAWFSVQNFQALVDQQKNVFLFNGAECSEPAIAEYLAHGVRKGTHQKFLTRHRSPWYRLENRPPAPIWFSVFTRQSLKIIRNEAGIFNLTCFHGFYPNDLDPTWLGLLNAYFLTPTAQAMLELTAREYGNGLKKYEPQDINDSLILDFRVIRDTQLQEMISIAKMVEQSQRTDPAASSSWIKDLDSMVLQLITIG